MVDRLVDGINKDKGDFEVVFTHLHGLSLNFKWLQKEDKCFMPTIDINTNS